MNILAALAFWVTIYLPAADFYTNQEHFENIVGAYTQLIVAGLAGFIVGQTINAWTVVKIKEHTKEKHLWARLVGSTFAGQLGDTWCSAASPPADRHHHLRRLRHLHRAGLGVQDRRRGGHAAGHLPGDRLHQTPRTHLHRAGVADALMSTMIRDYGDRALLLECGSTDEVLAVNAAIREAGLPGVLDVVPASRTVLVTLAELAQQGPTRQRLARLRIESAQRGDARDAGVDVVIDVVYDGADLAEVARHTGLAVAAVVDAHTAAPWRVGFGGFAPGFAYLVGGDPRLRVPRRAEPRRQGAGGIGRSGR